MPQLIRSIEGEVLDNFVGDTMLLRTIVGEIGLEDYVNLNGFIAYLQNFSRADEAEALAKPLNFGLINNKEIVTLEISY